MKTFGNIVKALIGGIIIGALAMAGIGFAFGLVVIPKKQITIVESEETVDVQVVLDRIIEMNELVTVSQDYATTVTHEDHYKFHAGTREFKIPATSNSFSIIYRGTLKAGVNLANANFIVDGTTVTVELDAPYIISNEPDLVRSEIVHARGNLFNPIKPENVVDAETECRELSQADALENGLLDEARANAEADLTTLLIGALGPDYTVVFVWR